MTSWAGVLVYQQDEFVADQVLSDICQMVDGLDQVEVVYADFYARRYPDSKPCFFSMALPLAYPAVVLCGIFDHKQIANQQQSNSILETWTSVQIGYKILYSYDDANAYVQDLDYGLYQGAHTRGCLAIPTSCVQWFKTVYESIEVEEDKMMLSQAANDLHDDQIEMSNDIAVVDAKELETKHEAVPSTTRDDVELDMNQIRNAACLWVQASFVEDGSIFHSLQSLAHVKPVLSLASQTIVVAAFALCHLPMEGLLRLFLRVCDKADENKAKTLVEKVSERAYALYGLDSNDVAQRMDLLLPFDTDDRVFLQCVTTCVQSIRWQQRENTNH